MSVISPFSHATQIINPSFLNSLISTNYDKVKGFQPMRNPYKRDCLLNAESLLFWIKTAIGKESIYCFIHQKALINTDILHHLFDYTITFVNSQQIQNVICT